MPTEIASDYFPEDILEFLSTLHQAGVNFVIVGGEAVIFHGYARLTGDIDVFYEFSEENNRRLFQALSVFWGGNIPGIKSKDDFSPGEILQFGVPPQRVDLLNEIDGVSFAEVWESKITATITVPGAHFEIYLIGIDTLLKNKRASGRPKDLQDLQFFEQDQGRSFIDE
ncbi:MAG: DUF6036 family nucleotidyltransferase [Kiritimatiellia bacterium]